jgi:hypothetical protein
MLNYECVLHGMVQKMKLDFAINVKLEGLELQHFVSTTEADRKMRLGRLSLPASKPQLNAFMKKVVLAEMSQSFVPMLSHSEEEAESEFSCARE